MRCHFPIPLQDEILLKWDILIFSGSLCEFCGSYEINMTSHNMNSNARHKTETLLLEDCPTYRVVSVDPGCLHVIFLVVLELSQEGPGNRIAVGNHSAAVTLYSFLLSQHTLPAAHCTFTTFGLMWTLTLESVVSTHSLNTRRRAHTLSWGGDYKLWQPHGAILNAILIVPLRKQSACCAAAQPPLHQTFCLFPLIIGLMPFSDWDWKTLIYNLGNRNIKSVCEWNAD